MGIKTKKDMHTWFEVAVKFEKTADDGNIIKVTQNYLVDALSHAEAEDRIIEEMKPFISGEFQVDKVARKKISELFFNDNGDKWYRAKVNFVTIDEEKGVEKRTGHMMYVQAGSLPEAVVGLIEGMKGTLADYEIHTMTETRIMDVYKFEATK